MSERDLHRIGALSEVVSGRRSVASAASLLVVSSRHVHRLLGRLEAGGGAALAHRARGRPPNNKIQTSIQDYAMALVREKYADFGPALAAV
ncbi:MAG: helix-turn-helix domain-containing protein [Janthinobacterium lividum]